MKNKRPKDLPGYVSDEMYNKYKEIYDLALEVDKIQDGSVLDAACPSCKNMDRPYWLCEKCNGIGFIEE